MNEYSAYQSDELAELYDLIYADVADIIFWQHLAEESTPGPLLELGCGTGRLMIPLARQGHEVVGLDLAPHMLARCRAKLEAESSEIRERVTAQQADMTSFELNRQFAMVYCPFGSFHHLRTVEQQLSCLEHARAHMKPGARLVLDLINPDPAPTSAHAHASDPGDDPLVLDSSTVGTVGWTNGRRVSSSARVVSTERSQQCNDCEVTYEVLEPDGSVRRLSETFPMRFVFRFELEHLLARCGFRIVNLWGDYDRSAYVDESLAMIVVAEAVDPAQYANQSRGYWTSEHMEGE